MEVGGTFGFAVAFLAGLLSFLSPCVLPIVPAFLTHLAGVSSATFLAQPGGTAVMRSERNIAFTHAAMFVLGFSVVFIILGASVGLIGYYLRDQLPTLTRVAGVFVILFGLQVAGILRVPFMERTVNFNVGSGKTGYAQSFLVGSAFSIGWTPCVGPVLGSILTLAYSSATVAQGAYLLLFYAAGLGVPFLLTGFAIGSARNFLRRINPALPYIEMFSGGLLVFIGILLVSNQLTIFNEYFDFFGLGEGL